MANKPINARWYQGNKDREGVENLVRNSTFLLSLLDRIIEEELRVLTTSEEKSVDYDSPSWAYKQAHRNGQRATLKELQRLAQHIKP